MDPAQVRVTDVAHAGRLCRQLDERLARVKLGEQGRDLRGFDGARRRHVAAREQPLVEGQQVWNEGDARIAPQRSHLLIDLRRMAMPVDGIGAHVLVR